MGGETVSGDVTITAQVTDPDDDLDLMAGVVFYIVRPGQTEGIQLATVKTAGGDGSEFSTLWDTRQVEDGPGYKVIVAAVDLAGRPGEAVSGEFTVDNSQIIPDGGDGDGVRYHFVIVDYLCDYVSGTVRAGSDAEQAAWVAPEELDRYRLPDKALEVVLQAFRIGGQVLH